MIPTRLGERSARSRRKTLHTTMLARQPCHLATSSEPPQRRYRISTIIGLLAKCQVLVPTSFLSQFPLAHHTNDAPLVLYTMGELLWKGVVRFWIFVTV